MCTEVAIKVWARKPVSTNIIFTESCIFHFWSALFNAFCYIFVVPCGRVATIARGQSPDTHLLLHSIKAWGPGVVWTPGLAAAENFEFYAFTRLFSKYLRYKFFEINKSEMLLKSCLKKVHTNILSRLTPPIFPDISLFSRNSGQPVGVRSQCWSAEPWF